MNDWIKKGAVGVTLLAAFALGGAAVAGAVQNSSGSPAAARTTTTAQGKPPQRDRGHHDPGGSGGRRSDETALTGETASKVRAAALAKVPGGAVERLETDADGNAAYEAHMAKADGSRVTVYVNRRFEVVQVEEGR
jgi:hypothetical protein